MTYKPLSDDILNLAPKWPDCSTLEEQCRRANRLAAEVKSLIGINGAPPWLINAYYDYLGTDETEDDT